MCFQAPQTPFWALQNGFGLHPALCFALGWVGAAFGALQGMLRRIRTIGREGQCVLLGSDSSLALPIPTQEEKIG